MVFERNNKVKSKLTILICLVGLFRFLNQESYISSLVFKNSSFISVIEFAIDFLIPSSVAQDGTDESITLHWEGQTGVDYEIEIYEKTSDKLISRIKTREPYLKYESDKPGAYYWQVRYKDNNRWSPFSTPDEIVIRDKVTLIKSPLMLSPIHKQEFEFSHDKKKAMITLSWEEPYPDIKYKLDIYKNDSIRPTVSIPVKGKSKTILFPNSSASYRWRIRGQSKYGGQTTNKEIFGFKIIKLPPPVVIQQKEPPKIYEFTSTLLVGYGAGTLKQSSEDSSNEDLNKSHSMSGTILNLQSKYTPNKKENGYTFHYIQSNLHQEKFNLSSFEIGADYLYKLGQKSEKSHYLIAGINYYSADMSNTSLPSGQSSVLSSSYSTLLLSTGYTTSLRFKKKYRNDITANLYLPFSSDFSNFSYRVGNTLFYQMSEVWSLTGQIHYEQFGSYYSFSNGTETGEINSINSNLVIGLGLSILH